MAHQAGSHSKIPNCDAYFETIQSKKKLEYSLQQSLTSAFAHIPASSFPQVPGGKVVEISSDTTVVDAIGILSEHNIMSAPVRKADAAHTIDWRGKYLGIIDYSAIVLWVLENAELAGFALSAGSVAVAGVGAGALGALGVGAVALGAGPVAAAGLAVAAVSAAVAGGLAAENDLNKDAPRVADDLGEDFYKVLVEKEPFKSTKVGSVVTPYRLRNVPVIEAGKPYIRNLITQSAVVQGLMRCRGSEWFDCIASRRLPDLGLPFMSNDKVINVNSDELILEAFKLMKENQIGGLPVTEGPTRKIVGNVSMRDIRFLLLKPELFSNFSQLTVLEFLKAIGPTNPISGSKYMAPPITCSTDACLESVIESLAIKMVHRIYVVDGNMSVIGVVTLRDVISCFIYEPPDHFDNYLGFAIEEMLNSS
ncbi:SNF1-related protein kinase regulatory subunit gamma-1-like isoform X2 [Asparagus officinalis]|uniref:SNF1-related protein kinase regulatory subunit gamma-1-like isoform X2 n=1 Tax=Asparagus officinalis TaxID=4686 RepID=UPI00098E3190|nr:SNF1-related protein kinase regulatory subunit gamma-1-like isoform X2 [Asparagus officinalis]